MSPPASVVRFGNARIGEAMPGLPVQSGTGVGEPLASVRSIWSVAAVWPAAADESSVNVITRDGSGRWSEPKSQSAGRRL